MAFSVYHVLGFKGFKGTIDGVNHDSTKVRVMLRCSERSGNEVGFDVAEYPCGKEDEYQKIKALVTSGQLKFPCHMELDCDDTNRGKECFGWKPVQSAAKG